MSLKPNFNEATGNNDKINIYKGLIFTNTTFSLMMVQIRLLYMLILELFPVASLKLVFSDMFLDPLQRIYITGSNLDKN